MILKKLLRINSNHKQIPSPNYFGVSPLSRGTLAKLMASLIKEEVSADADGGFVKKR